MIFENADVGPPSNADVCIVGSGPVGLALAFRCASQGLTTIILEAGTSGARPSDTALGTAEIATPYHAPLELIRAQGIGGTSRLWGGRCVMLDDLDFEQRDHVPYSGWPISHAEVAKYYGEALAFLGCGVNSETRPNECSSEEGDIVADTLERWSATPDLRRTYEPRLRTAQNIKVYTGCTVTNVVLDPDGVRAMALTVESKNGHSFEVEAKTFVLAAGGLENARLLLRTQRDWPQKFGGQDGALGRFYCGHLTGYLAAIRFNEQSFAKQLWYRRNRDGSQSRHRFAVSRNAQLEQKLLNSAFWLDSYSVADPAHGSGALSLLYFGLSMLGLQSRLGSGLAPSPTEPRSQVYGLHLANVRSDPKLLAATLHVLAQLLRKPLGQRLFALFNPGNRYLLRYHAEQAPHPDSRVQLSDNQPVGSLPTLRVDFRMHQQDIDSVVTSHAVLDRWLQEHGVGHLDFLVDSQNRSAIVLNQALDGYHQIGLTRMSEATADGIVDTACRVHGTVNLFVAGSSVLPTAGQANPTLPAVALALRLGDFLRRLL